MFSMDQKVNVKTIRMGGNATYFREFDSDVINNVQDYFWAYLSHLGKNML